MAWFENSEKVSLNTCKEPEISVRITNVLLSLMSALVVGVNALADISGWF